MDIFKPRRMTREQRSRAQGTRMARRLIRVGDPVRPRTIEEIRAKVYEMATEPMVSQVANAKRGDQFAERMERVAVAHTEDPFSRMDEPEEG